MCYEFWGIYFFHFGNITVRSWVMPGKVFPLSTEEVGWVEERMIVKPGDCVELYRADMERILLTARKGSAFYDTVNEEGFNEAIGRSPAPDDLLSENSIEFLRNHYTSDGAKAVIIGISDLLPLM